MKLAVMQPTYLPWIGYFDLLDQCDRFVLYDHVQFEKQSWQQRNRIRTAQGTAWLTVPVHQELGQVIVDVRINQTAHWQHKHWMALVSNYRRAPYWDRYQAALAAIYERPWERLADLTIHLIDHLASELGITTERVRSSSLSPEILQGHKAEPLVALCHHFGADTYLSPAGARSYLTSDEPFRVHNLRLEFHAFEHPVWPQRFGEFISHLSVIDLLFNVGPEALSAIRSGRCPAEPG